MLLLRLVILSLLLSPQISVASGKLRRPLLTQSPEGIAHIEKIMMTQALMDYNSYKNPMPNPNKDGINLYSAKRIRGSAVIVVFGNDNLDVIKEASSIYYELKKAKNIVNIIATGGYGRLTEALYDSIERQFGAKTLLSVFYGCDFWRYPQNIQRLVFSYNALPEGTLLRRILCNFYGIPITDTFEETQSRHTRENSDFSLDILKRKRLIRKSQNFILLQTPMQQRRAALTFHKALKDKNIKDVFIFSHTVKQARANFLNGDLEDRFAQEKAEMLKILNYSSKGDISVPKDGVIGELLNEADLFERCN